MKSSFSRRKKQFTRTIRHRAKIFIGTYPKLFFPLFRCRPAFADLLVDKKTDICIEGYPRSANSFAVGAFEYAQSRPVQVAHHTHVPANPMRACEEGIPTLGLIRDPYGAVLSYVALSKQVQMKEHSIEAPVQGVSFEDQLSAWVTFYRSVRPYRDRMVFASLSAVVQDMGLVIDRVNAHFGTNFDRFEHTPEAVADVHAGRGYHAGPSEQRDKLKANTRADFDAQLQSDTALRQTLEKANALYDTLTSERTAERQ